MNFPLEKQLDSILSDGDFPVGGAVVVIREKQIAYAKGFG
jgi:hypothetical protein